MKIVDCCFGLDSLNVIPDGWEYAKLSELDEIMRFLCKDDYYKSESEEIRDLFSRYIPDPYYTGVLILRNKRGNVVGVLSYAEDMFEYIDKNEETQYDYKIILTMLSTYMKSELPKFKRTGCVHFGDEIDYYA